MPSSRPQLTALLAAVLLAIGVAEPALAITEADIKAALFIKIAKFTRWPASVFELPTSSLHLCVLGEDELSASMKTLEEQLVHGRSLRVRAIEKSIDVLDDCQAVYVAADRRQELRDVISAASSQPILTVGDTDDFRELGGILGFVLDKNRMRFRINLSSTEKSGLEFNAQLLQLAILESNDAGDSS